VTPPPSTHRPPLDYIHSGEKFWPDPPYLFDDDDSGVYRLLDNKTIGSEHVTLTRLTFVPIGKEAGYDGVR